MFGLMQGHPLLISTIFEHATKNYSKQEIVSNTIEGGIHRYTYLEWGKRTKKLANAFKSFDLKESDRVGTLAWNGYRHLEIYYATSSSGLVSSHTTHECLLRRSTTSFRTTLPTGENSLKP